MCHLFAYLDAGTGSMLLQAMIGGFAGLMVLSRVTWHALRPHLTRLGLGRNEAVTE